MIPRRFRAAIALGGVVLLSSGEGGAHSPPPRPPVSAFVETLATADTLAQMRRGGFVLYLRHGNTNTMVADRIPAVDLGDCATQRPLSEGGRLMAVRIGEVVRQAGISIGELLVSPFCRTRDTAAAAFPERPVQIDPVLIDTAHLSSGQKAPILAHLRGILSTPPAPGTNRVVVGHAPNLMDLIGYFPREGTLVVFRPRGNGDFSYVASIPPALWLEILP